MSASRYTTDKHGRRMERHHVGDISFDERLARAIEQAEKEDNNPRADVLRKILGMHNPPPAKNNSSTVEEPDQQKIEPESDEQPESEESKSSEPEEGDMSENNRQPEEKSAARNTLGVLARAGLHGTKVAAASAANREMVDLVEELLGEHYPDLMKTPVGRPIAELIAPLLLLQATNMFPERFPKVEYVQAGCEYALEAVSRDSLEPLLRMIVPMSKKLANVGAEFMSESVQKVRSSGLPAIEEQLEDAEEIASDREIEQLRKDAEKFRAEAAANRG